VTVRAVRHYHQRGCSPSPPGTPQGYRRYHGRAAVELIRIKTLAEAGMALARIRVLLDAEPGEFGEAVTQVDEALKKTRDHPGAAA
jgi:DNA-binding transcriptional MerR regulator